MERPPLNHGHEDPRLFDPQESLAYYANPSRQHFERDWLGVGENTPDEIAQSARDVSEYLSNRPDTAPDESGRLYRERDMAGAISDAVAPSEGAYARSPKGEDSQQVIRAAKSTDLLDKWAAANIANDRTTAEDVQRELKRRIFKDVPEDDPKYNDATRRAEKLQAAQDRFDRLSAIRWNRENRMGKAGLPTEPKQVEYSGKVIDLTTGEEYDQPAQTTPESDALRTVGAPMNPNAMSDELRTLYANQFTARELKNREDGAASQASPAPIVPPAPVSSAAPVSPAPITPPAPAPLRHPAFKPPIVLPRPTGGLPKKGPEASPAPDDIEVPDFMRPTPDPERIRRYYSWDEETGAHGSVGEEPADASEPEGEDEDENPGFIPPKAPAYVNPEDEFYPRTWHTGGEAYPESPLARGSEVGQELTPVPAPEEKPRATFGDRWRGITDEAGEVPGWGGRALLRRLGALAGRGREGREGTDVDRERGYQDDEEEAAAARGFTSAEEIRDAYADLEQGQGPAPQQVEVARRDARVPDPRDRLLYDLDE